jgi:hypothetical protein
MSDELLLGLARLALVAAAAVWAVRIAAALRGRGPWWVPLWPPALLVAVAALAPACLAALTDNSLAEAFDAGRWRDAGGALVGR